MDSIIVFREYGDIELDIKSVMDKKHITISQVVKKTGLHHQVVRRYYDGTAVRYDKDVLARLCFVLDCELNEIMHYKRIKNK